MTPRLASPRLASPRLASPRLAVAGLLLGFLLLAQALSANAQGANQSERSEQWKAVGENSGSSFLLRGGNAREAPRMALVAEGAASKTYLGDAELAARRFLAANRAALRVASSLDSLQLVSSTPAAEIIHLRFQQLVNGIPVKGAQYLVHIRSNGSVIQANGRHYLQPRATATAPAIAAAQALSAAINFAQGKLEGPERDAHSDRENHDNPTLVYIVDDEQYQQPPSTSNERDSETGATHLLLAWNVPMSFKNSAWIATIDATTGSAIALTPTALEAEFEDQGSNANTLLAPFALPDQLTPIGMAGSVMAPFTSLENSVVNAPSSAFIPKGRVYLTHPGLDSSTPVIDLPGLPPAPGTSYYSLGAGTYASVKHAFTNASVGSTYPYFTYNPTDVRFEDVNVFYHMTKMRFYINGISGLGAGTHPFAPAKTNAGNVETSFQPVGSGGFIQFGNRPGTPAPTPINMSYEDKIVHHEYVHSLFYKIGAFYSSDFSQLGAMSEGLADYFAGAYTGRPRILDWAVPAAQRDMVLPIGNYRCGTIICQNPIRSWADYTAAATNMEPNAEPNGIQAHRGGEFISHVLWGIRASGTIVPSRADRIVFSATMMLPPSASFLDLRDQMLVADQTLFNGANRTVILNGFAAKGLSGGAPPPPLMSAFISGPTCQDSSQPNTFFVSYSGGALPMTPSWNWRALCGMGATQCGEWNAGPVGTTSMNATFSFPYEVRATITDVSGFTKLSNVVYVSYASGGCAGGGGENKAEDVEDIAAVDVKGEILALEVARPLPNPARVSANLTIGFPDEANAVVSIVDMLGRTVVEGRGRYFGTGYHDVSVAINNLAPGIYRVVVNSTDLSSGRVSNMSVPLTVANR